MKLLKLITAYCMLLHSSLLPADTITTPQDTPTESPTPVVLEINENDNIDMVLIQHEFGLFRNNETKLILFSYQFFINLITSLLSLFTIEIK